MHESSSEKMKELLARYCVPGANLKILEIGSLLIGGDPAWPDGYPVGGFRADVIRENLPGKVPFGSYVGLDIVPGVNVNIVAGNAYQWPVEDGEYDMVISGQCMEHVEDLVRWMQEVFRCVKLGGLTIHIAPSAGSYHAFPVDCWRIMKDGMRFLLTRAGFEILEVDQHDAHPWNDCWGVGRKPG